MLCPIKLTYNLYLIISKSKCEVRRSMWWRSWLTHCATSRKVTGSIPNGVTGIFHWHNPSSCIMAVGLTQPLTEMSNRYISWGRVKADVAFSWQPYHLHALTVLKSGSLNLLEPWGPVQAYNLIVLPLLFKGKVKVVPVHTMKAYRGSTGMPPCS
jgi:hypothetical protein